MDAMKIVLGLMACAFALLAHYGTRGLWEDYWVIAGSVCAYGALSSVLQWAIPAVEKHRVSLLKSRGYRQGPPSISLETETPLPTGEMTIRARPIGSKVQTGAEVKKCVSEWVHSDGHICHTRLKRDVGSLLTEARANIK